MPQRFNFDSATLKTLVGGQSVIDIPALKIESLAEASAFIKSYGFDIEQPNDLQKLWYYHRRAMVLLVEKLDFKLEEIPEVLRDRSTLDDIRNLLLWASSRDPRTKDLQKWSCALLRIIHVFVHAENDLFSTFSEEIQKQILSPFQACIVHDGKTSQTFLKRSSEGPGEAVAIPLLGFEVKPFKTSSSTVIKLLAKPNALAMNVFDKLGVRFIAKSMFDCFRVIRFLVEENLISFPHAIPDQSHNNMYPVVLFLKACEELIDNKGKYNEEAIKHYLERYYQENKHHAEFLKKENSFSGEDYRSLKFICRKLIRIQSEKGESFSFFYPFEVQILDHDAHQKLLSGPSHHQAYKERQRLGARKRLFPEGKQ